MTEADLPEVARIEGPGPWRPSEYLQFDAWVAETGPGAIAGFISTRTVFANEEYEVLNLVVDAQHRRKGVGRALLEEAMNACPGIWFLEVRSQNGAAISLYKSLSFSESGVRAGYYQNPPDNGIVMVRKS